MPCNSEHMEQNPFEKYCQRTAKLLVFTYDRLGYLISRKLKEAANTYYCTEDYTEELCSVLTKAIKQGKEEFIFDIKNKESRDLMDWWQEHVAADKARIRAEKEKEENKKLINSALKKLTKKERKALLGE